MRNIVFIYMHQNKRPFNRRVSKLFFIEQDYDEFNWATVMFEGPAKVPYETFDNT